MQRVFIEALVGIDHFGPFQKRGRSIESGWVFKVNVMTKDESLKLVELSEKIATLISSHASLCQDVKEAKAVMQEGQTAIAVLNERYGHLKSRVDSWNALNSLGVVLAGIGAAIGLRQH